MFLSVQIIIERPSQILGRKHSRIVTLAGYNFLFERRFTSGKVKMLICGNCMTGNKKTIQRYVRETDYFVS
jgi:hypothetical protein